MLECYAGGTGHANCLHEAFHKNCKHRKAASSRRHELINISVNN